MVTIEQAVEELNERIDLWTAYRTNEPKWAEVMKMARDALIREKGNAEYFKTIRGQLATLKDDDKLTVRLFQEILSGIKIREAPQDDTTGG